MMLLSTAKGAFAPTHVTPWIKVKERCERASATTVMTSCKRQECSRLLMGSPGFLKSPPVTVP
jgi:hypothetical protein